MSKSISVSPASPPTTPPTTAGVGTPEPELLGGLLDDAGATDAVVDGVGEFDKCVDVDPCKFEVDVGENRGAPDADLEIIEAVLLDIDDTADVEFEEAVEDEDADGNVDDDDNKAEDENEEDDVATDDVVTGGAEEIVEAAWAADIISEIIGESEEKGSGTTVVTWGIDAGADRSAEDGIFEISERNGTLMEAPRETPTDRAGPDPVCTK